MAKKTIRMRKQKTIYIRPIYPFSFVGTFFKPSHFPSKLVYWQNGQLYQGIRISERILGLVISDASRDAKPRVKIDIYSDTNVTKSIVESLRKEIIFRYNLAGDISEFVKNFKSDPLLISPIKRWGGMRPSISYSLYEFLMVTTVLQNATVRRSVQMLDNLLNDFGIKLTFAGQEVFIIWQPRDMTQISEEKLKKLKVGYRAKIIKRISDDFVAALIDEENLRQIKNKEEVRKQLLHLYGVGPQSVSYILFEAFHFYEALNYLSPWEQKIYSQLIFNNKKTSAKRIIATAKRRWGRWCMLALHYLFEDIFWRRQSEEIPWLEKEIRI